MLLKDTYYKVRHPETNNLPRGPDMEFLSLSPAMHKAGCRKM